MTWRIVSVSKTSKLDLKLNHLVVRGDVTKKVHLSEISILMIENTAVSLTAALLCELSKRKIKVIFCDEKRNPYGELIPYYGSHDSTEKLRNQISWNDETTKNIWTEIVKEKILNQSLLLKRCGLEEHELLLKYVGEVERYDSTNREGHAAKVYFNALFGKSFSRSDDCPINSCLNYGYAIILSAVNREISISGYFTQLGIFHDNIFNPFNLASDLMEPFRILVDECVFDMSVKKLESEEKLMLVDILNKEVTIDGKRNFVNNAIKIYCRSVFDAIENNDVKLLRFYKNETEIHEADSFL